MTTTEQQPCYSEQYVEALRFAADRHRHQTKKTADGSDGVPYITHLMGVSALIWEDGGDENQAIAGLLPDVVDDTPTQPDELRALLGERVAAMGELGTDANPAHGEAKAPWRARKEAHVEHLRSVADPAGLLVILADKVHNVEAQLADARHAAAVGPAEEAVFWSLFKGGYYGTLWYLQQVRAALGDRLGGSRLLERFDTRLDEFARLHTPGARERELRDVLDTWVQAVDPARVGEQRAERGHYDMDASELARRMALAKYLGMHEGQLGTHYIKVIYGLDPPAR